MTYVVIQSVPGYMPTDEDPPTFDDLLAANEYLRDEVDRYLEQMEDDEEHTYDVQWDAAYPEESWSAHIITHESHDLGWIIEIVEVGDES